MCMTIILLRYIVDMKCFFFTRTLGGITMIFEVNNLDEAKEQREEEHMIGVERVAA